MDIVSAVPLDAYVLKLDPVTAAVVAACVMFTGYGVADGCADVPAETKLRSLSLVVAEVTNRFFTAVKLFASAVSNVVLFSESTPFESVIRPACDAAV
jgi:hypothetical protein